MSMMMKEKGNAADAPDPTATEMWAESRSMDGGMVLLAIHTECGHVEKFACGIEGPMAAKIYTILESLNRLGPGDELVITVPE